MSLIGIKHYLMKVKTASLVSLCALFQADAETIRCLVNHLIRKGCVRQCTREPACGTACFKCPVAVTEVYEWVNI
jgi:hypothetical protein